MTQLKANPPAMTPADERGGLYLNPITGVGILGTASAFPTELGEWVANDDVHRALYGADWRATMAQRNLDPAYPEKKHGFVRRYRVSQVGSSNAESTATSADLMEAAARDALHNAGVAGEEIDLFIAVTTTSPRYTTSLGALVGGRLGLHCASFELKAGCSSNLYALALAYQLIAGGARRVLIAGGETLSRITPPEAPLAYATGDAGAAVVLGRVDDPARGLCAAYLNSDGSYAHAMGTPGTLPPRLDSPGAGDFYLGMSSEVNAPVQERWLNVGRWLQAEAARRARPIRAFVAHQPSVPLVRAAADAAGVSERALVETVRMYGNCGSVSVLIALHAARGDGRAAPGENVMFAAVGGGLAWGGLLVVA